MQNTNQRIHILQDINRLNELRDQIHRQLLLQYYLTEHEEIIFLLRHL
jgi:hypothetical protein